MIATLEKKRRKSPAATPIERAIFARNFQQARKTLSLNQGDVAACTGLTQGFISEVERGLSNISLDNMAKLAHLVGVPLHLLLHPNPGKLDYRQQETPLEDETAIRQVFGHHLHLARKTSNLSQEAVCSFTGSIQAFISEVERGSSNISLDNMAKLATVVGQPLYQLLNPRFNSPASE